MCACNLTTDNLLMQLLPHSKLAIVSLLLCCSEQCHVFHETCKLLSGTRCSVCWKGLYACMLGGTHTLWGELITPHSPTIVTC